MIWVTPTKRLRPSSANPENIGFTFLPNKVRCLQKGGGQQAQKDFVESYVRRKGLVFNHVTNKFTRRSKRYEKEK